MRLPAYQRTPALKRKAPPQRQGQGLQSGGPLLGGRGHPPTTIRPKSQPRYLMICNVSMIRACGTERAVCEVRADSSRASRHVREWDGPAVLLPPTAHRVDGGFRARGTPTMACKTDPAIARTIGIDTGKNTLHIIGLDEDGAIVLREKVSRNRRRTTCEHPAMPGRYRSRYGNALCGPRIDCARSRRKASAAGLFQAVPSRP